ncbi:hypothetical protein [Oleiagrimonas soli]|uniref:Uncharacterized protein n=1 Tax=Oleiagrimonas soli TaxID=1543381 RepID=A0A841KEU5_9GAMM|nr:hypothetical protein [Oleiagrimonas soli]MBB6183500.1 hypothetical protein [Oleiagrimonas soli]
MGVRRRTGRGRIAIQQIDLPKNSGFTNIGDVKQRNTDILKTLGKLNVK